MPALQNDEAEARPGNSALRPWLGAALWLLSGLALQVALLAGGHALLGRPAVDAFDRDAMLRVHAGATPLRTAAALALTRMGSILFLGGALLAVLPWLLWRERRKEATVLAGAMGGALLLNETLKLHFHRERPHLPWSLGDEHTFSYPSGHTFFAVTLYGTLLYLALRRAHTPQRRVAVAIPALLMPLLIGWSRIYLGMHFPTDVAAGYVAGLVWTGTVVALDRRWSRMAAGAP